LTNESILCILNPEVNKGVESFMQHNGSISAACISFLPWLNLIIAFELVRTAQINVTGSLDHDGLPLFTIIWKKGGSE